MTKIVRKPKLTSAEKEYKGFIEEFLLQIIGLPSQENNVRKCDDSEERKTGVVFYDEKNKKVFFSSNKKPIFFIQVKYPIISENIRVAREIVQVYFKVAKYRFEGMGQRYPSELIKQKNYEFAVQEGICRWVRGKKDNSEISRLFHLLEEWSVKTYEGKKVTFAFVLNSEETSAFSAYKEQNWLDFLSIDYSATLTDCIHSAILLDANCNFVRYLSLTETNEIQSYSLDNRLPYRFAGIIQKYVNNSAVGIFLLNNGDIVLSKNGTIMFVKRNLKWLNMSYGVFANIVKMHVKDDKEEILQKNVYATALDVSFAHTGGIIAVVKDIDLLRKEGILCEADYLLNEESDEYIIEHIKRDKPGVKEGEIRKIMLKRAALMSLISRNDFVTIDRKLRTEIISMDGACILDSFGKVCAAGAVIKNDSGSSEGGRGSAARKLSKHGVAIKISTDGYIEIYEDEKVRFSIK